MKILRQIMIMGYAIGLFELWKFFFPDIISKDWIFILVFTSVAPIILHYALREHDEWRRERDLEEIKRKKWLNKGR